MNELYLSSSAASAPFAVIRRKSDLRVASIAAEAFVTFAGADVADYVVQLADGGGNVWAANFPAWITAGEYLIAYHDQAGSSVVLGDLDSKLKEADLLWTGTSATTGGDVPTAAEMVTLIKQALRDNPIGLVLITVDGKTTQFERAQALSELQFWQKQAAAESGARRRVMRIDLSRGFGC